ncbi:MAG: class I SAM-dependent methyltransferase [Synechococcales bacterium]|nr:class I SAM-dependent methyltransferase [Synechococcales bacterium]
MNLYSRYVFPRLLDLAMSSEALAKHRRSLLADVQGHVLEIGFGTGLNLPYYSSAVTHLTTVDPNPGVNVLAQRRVAESVIPVEFHLLWSEALPFGGDTFDCAVSTWTLCSIPQVEQALQELYRVLKPGGKFFFIEHGLSPDPQLQIWQNRLTPLQKIIADGCHLNRNMRSLVTSIFSQVQLSEFIEPSLPKIGGYFYQGIAVKEASQPRH